jgi:hypothetical protein
MPRHPPCALKNLTTKTKMLASTMQFSRNQGNPPAHPTPTTAPTPTPRGAGTNNRAVCGTNGPQETRDPHTHKPHMPTRDTRDSRAWGRPAPPGPNNVPDSHPHHHHLPTPGTRTKPGTTGVLAVTRRNSCQLTDVSTHELPLEDVRLDRGLDRHHPADRSRPAQRRPRCSLERR